MSFLFFIVLVIWIFALQSRVSRLEEQLRRRQAPPRSVADEAPPQSHSEYAEAPRPRPEPERVEPPTFTPEAAAQFSSRTANEPMRSREAVGFDLFEWLKENFLIKMGALLLFLGIAWFVSYAFSQGWVPPEIRILLGLCAAVIVYGLSAWRIKRERTQGIVLNALGTGIVLAVVSAAQFAYDMFPPLVALLIMVAAIIYTTAIGVRMRHELLSVTAAIAGLVAPLLTNNTEPDMAAFFSYLLVYATAFIWVAARMGWGSVILTLLLGIGFYEYLYYISDEISNMFVFLVFAFIFGALFYLASLIGALVNQKVSRADLYIGALNSFLLLVWIYTLVPDAFQSTVSFVVAAIAGATAYTLYENGVSAKLIYLHVSIGAAFLIAATAFEFSGHTLVLMYALESGLVLCGAMLIGLPQRFVHFAIGFFALPILLSLDAFTARAWKTGWLHDDAYALYSVFAVAVIVAAIAFARAYWQTFRVFFSLTLIYGLSLIWLVSHAIFVAHIAYVLSLISYTAISMALVFAGTLVRAAKEDLYVITGIYVLPGLMSLSLLMQGRIWQDAWFHAEFVAIAFFILSLFSTGLWLGVLSKEAPTAQAYDKLQQTLYVTGGLFLAAFIWRVAHGMFPDDIAVMSALFVYAVTGLLMYVYGRVQEVDGMRIAAGFVLGAVVLRLLLVDVWQMEILWRVVTFVVIGALFIGTSLFERPRFMRSSDHLSE